MLIFCEECGTRHDIEIDAGRADGYHFRCDNCNETLILSKCGDKRKAAFAAMHQHPDIKNNNSESPKLKVMVVDDSKLIRKAIKEIVESDGTKIVIGEAENGSQALGLLLKLEPDIITLDINMPVMDGITTLKHIMLTRPTPTVMISALSKDGALETFESLRYGAIDFLPKPSKMQGADLKQQKKEILNKIEIVANVQIECVKYLRNAEKKSTVPADDSKTIRSLVVFGAAEGGYGSLLNVLPRLQAATPACFIAVIKQPAVHVDSFTNYLKQYCSIDVQRAVNDLPLKSGTCYLVAAEEHVSVVRKDEKVTLAVAKLEVAAEKGQIDLLMNSVAETFKNLSVGIILTGAGSDGVKGLGEIISSGGTTFVQDPLNSLYKEAPLAAINCHSIDLIVSDKQMAAAISSHVMLNCK